MNKKIKSITKHYERYMVNNLDGTSSRIEATQAEALIDKLGLVPVPSLIFSGAILFREQYQQEMDDITFQKVLRLAKKNVEKMEGER